MNSSTILKQIENCIYNGDEIAICIEIKKALDMNISPKSIVDDALLQGITILGRRFRDGEVYVPDVILAAEAMKAGLSILKPLLESNCTTLHKKILIGTVENDLHDIGKTLVICSFTAAGFDVIDLGIDVSPDKFIDAILQEKPDLLALSCTLSYTLNSLKNTVEEIQKALPEKNVKIIVGGNAVTSSFASSIGASAYSINENHAAMLALKLIQNE